MYGCDDVDRYRNQTMAVQIAGFLISLLFLCSAAGAAGTVMNPVVTRVPADYFLMPTTTQAPDCPAPCECMAQAAAKERWGDSGYVQCAGTPCGRVVTGSAVIPLYCYRPLTAGVTRTALPVTQPVHKVTPNLSVIVPSTLVAVRPYINQSLGLADADEDGVRDSLDNCPGTANADQEDSDAVRTSCSVLPESMGGGIRCEYEPTDNIGDACDNCPHAANPGQEDSDAVTTCRVLPESMGGGIECTTTSDGFGDLCDNCPYHWNPDQADADGNGAGDACQDPCSMNVNTVQAFSWTTWRGTNWMTPVKNQAVCGSCYAQSPTGTLEAMYNIGQGSQQNLNTAEQVFVSPCFTPAPGSCLGGSEPEVITLLKNSGVPDETVMPYQSFNCVHSVPNADDPTKTHLECNEGITGHCAIPNSCSMGALAPDHVWKITSSGSSSGTVAHVKQQLLCRGPLSVCSGSWWHCVVLVGWDNNVNGGSWLIKNSWGTGWGTNGYGWILFDGEDRSEIRDAATYLGGVYRVGGA